VARRGALARDRRARVRRRLRGNQNDKFLVAAGWTGAAPHNSCCQRRKSQYHFVEGVATAITPIAFFETVMVKSYETLVDSNTKVDVNTGMVAAGRLQSLIDSRDYSHDLLVMKVQMDQICDAVRSVVPQEMWGEIVEKLEELEHIRRRSASAGTPSMTLTTTPTTRPSSSTRTTSFDLRSYPDVPLWTNGSRSTGRARPSCRRTSGSPQINLVRCRIWCGRRPTGVDLVGYVLSWRNRGPLRTLEMEGPRHQEVFPRGEGASTSHAAHTEPLPPTTGSRQ
jgi:hypothetical protein